MFKVFNNPVESNWCTNWNCMHLSNSTVFKMVKRHSVLKNPIKPKWTFSGGFAYLFFPHQTTLIWFFSLLLLLFPNIDINFVPPSFACILHDRGDKINMHSDGRIKKKFIVHWTLKFKSAKNAIWGLTSWNQIFLTEKKLILLQCGAVNLYYGTLLSILK